MFIYVFLLLFSLFVILAYRYEYLIRDLGLQGLKWSQKSISFFHKNKNRFYYILLVYMALIASVRYYVGTDYWKYEEGYINNDFWFPEVGLKVVANIFHFFNLDVQLFFLAIAISIQLLIVKSLREYSENNREILVYALFFFITFYYFNHSMNIIRQYIAIGILFLNFNNIVEKKFIKYNIYFVFMLLFHQSSIILYPVYFIPRLFKKVINNRSYRNIALLLSFGLMFVRFDELITSILLKFGGRFSYYAKWGAEKYLEYDLSWKMLIVLIVKLIITLWIVNNKEKFIKTKKQEVLFTIYFFGMVLTFILYPMLIFRRLLMYINIVEIVIYALFIQKQSKHGKMILISWALMYYFAHLLSGFSDPLPYQTVF
ncbi:EpsG family protein [Salinibacillus xinjiangensis]|uniref:EpsG family protein n=1 Tax=Salinibacillus xinjiangensis TaxID=1229268 RepID=A0A6G1X255_9BACI|nr:EpsG family protein [Salinibacillus xinjiangensis]MRG85071.1 EpsG family protein [Salinibacillus xinjiangensis]